MNVATAPSHASCPSQTQLSPGISLIGMNSNAVLKISQGRINEAVADLQAALTLAKAMLANECDLTTAQVYSQRSSSTTHPSEGNHIDCDEIPCLSLFSVPLFEEHSKRGTSPPGHAEGGLCPLFDRAIVIGSDAIEVPLNAEQHSQSLTIGVLLYNTALCHHLMASSSQDYQASLGFYRMALSLFQGQNQDEYQNLAVLFCAIANNMASIYAVFYDEQETRNCLECLQEIIESCIESSRYLAEDDHLFFHLHLHLTAPTHIFGIAPAA